MSVYGATFQKLGDRPGIKKGDAYQSSTTEEKPVFDVEDMASVMIRFDNGAVLSIEASFSLNIEKDEGKIELFGTKAGAKLDPELTLYSQQAGYMTNTTIATGTALSFDGLFENEIRHFVSCVEDGTACRAPGGGRGGPDDHPAGRLRIRRLWPRGGAGLRSILFIAARTVKLSGRFLACPRASIPV